MTKRSPYSEEQARPEICISERKYLFLYPMVKQRRWYGLPPEERGRIMKSHIEVGRRYPEITINTTYSFGIDDQEFVVCFEGDDPGDVPRPRQRAAPDRVERVHRARDADLHLRGDVGRARRSTRSTAPPARSPPSARRRSARRRARIPYSSALHMSKIGTEENPLRVAIVGAGPSGFYAAEHILKDEDLHAQVDLFDRLPTPFGLVRGGVAPDHPKIKSVIRVYEKTAARDGFRFFGNVKIGHDIEVEDLERLYHAIVFTVGCETDRQLGVPGEDLPGSHAATAFVGWYNAHPDYADHDFDLSSERAVVIGNGNVAMDVARMLALTDHELRQTDTADHAIELLDAKQIREIVVLGRRGPVQAAFTNPEIKELGEMEDADVDRRPGRGRARPGQRRLPRVRRGRQDDPRQRRDPARVLPAQAGGQAAADRPPLPRLAGRDQGRRQGRDRSSSAATSWSRRAARCAPRTPASAKSSSAAWSCARSATPASRSRASPSTRSAA